MCVSACVFVYIVLSVCCVCVARRSISLAAPEGQGEGAELRGTTASGQQESLVIDGSLYRHQCIFSLVRVFAAPGDQWEENVSRFLLYTRHRYLGIVHKNHAVGGKKRLEQRSRACVCIPVRSF